MTSSRSYSPACLFVIALMCSLSLWPADAAAQPPSGGRVVDTSGAPLVRVRVTLERPDRTVLATTFTDAFGHFAFDRRCQQCRAVAVLPGFVETSATITTGVATMLTLSVAPVQEAVVVTATRSAAPTSQVGASVTVFNPEDIRRRGAPLVGDLLRAAPGAVVVQNGGQGNVTSLFVRGGENNYTKVLLDGIAINEPGGAFNFGGLTTGHLDRVEFVRGAQSALFGSDAMAGVLQLVSRRGHVGERPTVAGEIGAGGYGTMRGSASVSGGTSRWDYSVHAGRYETDNRVANNHLDSTTVSFTAGGSIAPGLTLRLVGRYEDGRTGAPGQTAFGRPDLDAAFSQSHRVAGVSLEHTPTSVFTQRVTYALAASEQRSTNLVPDAPYTPAYQGRQSPFEFYDFTYDTGSTFSRHQAGYQADLRLTHGGAMAGAEFVTLALDWDGERGTLSDFMADSSTSPGRDNFGVSLQHQHVSRRVALTTGLRIEHNEQFGTAIVPRVSAAVFLREGTGGIGSTTIKSNAGRGIKEPTLRQSFSLSPFDLGNPTLEAEESRAFDVGLEQRLLNDRLKIEATWFDNRFERQISTRTISFSPYLAQYINVGSTRARGTEVIAEFVPVAELRVAGSYTFTDSEIVDPSSEFSEVLAAGHWALRRPRHVGQAQAFWDRGRVSLDAAGTYLGRRSDSDFSSLVPAIMTADGYWLWRLQTQVRITMATTGYVRIENLTDADYMEPLGYPAWRRTVHAGLRFRF